MSERREGNLEAPTRHPLGQQEEAFWDEDSLFTELERVYDICHGCRRCVSLCDSFPTLFDLVDESETLEVDGIDKQDYYKVVDQCYMCDLCYMTKCPYVPPHEWNVDFPHLMLRAKAQRFKNEGASFRDRTLTNTDLVGKLASIPLIDVTVNALNKNGLFRNALEATLGVHHEAPVPDYHAKTLRKRFSSSPQTVKPVGRTTGKVAFYATCYGNYNTPDLGEDFVKVFEHNNIQIDLVPKEACCGMPKLELGDLETVEKLMRQNIPVLAKLVDEGYDLIAPIPSCVLMYKQELPLMYPDDPDVQKVKKAFFDPFEYLHLRHREGEFNLDFKTSLGDISYQVACHLRVQNIGLKTRDILNLVQDTQVSAIERCSGHDGTYAVKKETRAKSLKIAKPVVRQVDQKKPQHFTSDCPMAGVQISSLATSVDKSEHPMTLLRLAYGI
ncbi:MAG: heterodisulfide reductase-related iron-sulfur binding cluster [Pseudomonadales bacterium]|jgi:glycerol-3-phosphate dehydrogenase subunit C|nr:heterodisulfide reductase-related iron-sulfur binding cluster [Pseudomonadales bacterium]MDP4765811.1 heterodisulfide reductase-related iron-sulfur binding cluster [Pseudomonadales bacterium]MDP4875686.1 heterodisulfide reductase-related iron-sulfur binding cluster [Pseudomonadales bacterium]MDP4912566.1 heterodisulfide reductase-related iron-sulfur binding cluster [Pseudomonadales bacterium]MDP5058560.1 heterodisulfide reductase-related iron-sulfur binding cluster [Pseudomonadales bacterium